ncbi:hypothetical protein LPN01_16340 [Sphingomonas sp. A2-49]|uniref:hypothetical protein n=1 Tax=Sphingomonas sp. A2-49 TaxID=1391375 RepID=UPI0021D2CADB|nr:hypothetical protein [Sphingomonas sp. A2-49]MCU6455650.1 hypothetical protein [Sphingomonas sp. A2-49]
MLLQALPLHGTVLPPPDPIPVRCGRACVEKTPARRISGIWINYFEGSVFIEGAQRIEDTRNRRDAPWFEIDDRTEVPRDFRRFYDRAYRVTLDGWRSPIVPKPDIGGGYGHMGYWHGQILADRIVSIEDVGSADLPE